MAKTFKRVISLLLAAVLVVAIFAGCGKSNKEKEVSITAADGGRGKKRFELPAIPLG